MIVCKIQNDSLQDDSLQDVSLQEVMVQLARCWFARDYDIVCKAHMVERQFARYGYGCS